MGIIKKFKDWNETYQAKAKKMQQDIKIADEKIQEKIKKKGEELEEKIEKWGEDDHWRFDGGLITGLIRSIFILRLNKYQWYKYEWEYVIKTYRFLKLTFNWVIGVDHGII